MHSWESKIMIQDGQIGRYLSGNNIRQFKLISQPIQHKILQDVTIDALGYNGITPGPLIVVNQGEWIFLEVENQMDEPTALHVHGLAKPNKEDGAPDIEPTPLIQPGESYTYKFNCWQSGTFFYHSAQNFQSNLGLLGGFIVLPNDYSNITKIPDRDYTMVLQQWQLNQPEVGKVFPGTYKPIKFGNNPNFFTINGKSLPDTTPMYTRYGEKLRFRFINKSSSSHSMHTHGHDFHVVEVDGFSRSGMMDDTINIASGQRWDVEFIANNPGIWPINGTKTFHQSNNGETPGGMITRLIYTE